MSDVILNKATIISRCMERIREEFGDGVAFQSNYTKQDSVILNLQRACEACIDIANYLIKQHNLGIPQSARDSFDLIAKAGLIDQTLCLQLKKMVGLRNIAVHSYQELNMDIVASVVRHHLGDFQRLSSIALDLIEAP